MSTVAEKYKLQGLTDLVSSSDSKNTIEALYRLIHHKRDVSVEDRYRALVEIWCKTGVRPWKVVPSAAYKHLISDTIMSAPYSNDQ